MDQKKTTLVITLFIVCLLSVFLGSAIGQSRGVVPLDVVLAIVGLFVVLIVLSLGEQTWILIPVFAAWTGKVSLLPIPFSVSNLVVGLSVFVWFLTVATRRQNWKFQANRFDWVIGLTIIILILGYFRNPVGFAAFASGDNIGGRVYAEVGIAFVAYLLLAGQNTHRSLVEKLPVWVLVSTSVIAAGGAVAMLAPQAGIILYQFYSGFMPDLSELLDPYGGEGGVGRARFLRPLSFALAAYVGCKVNPLRLVRPDHWGFLLLLAISTGLALVSGFRSALITVGCYFVCAMWFWLRGLGLVLCSFVAIGFIAIVVSVHQFVALPDQVQRSLSFIPGPWDQRIVRDAEESTEWRIEMWEYILKGNAIDNWWIGDGFGVSQSDVEYFGNLYLSNQLSPEQLAEYFLITGTLHSGPLSAAKYAGTIGFMLYVILAIMVFLGYVRSFKRLGGLPQLSKFRGVIVFYGIMASYIPIKFIFIAGFYETELPTLIISAGLCRLLSRLVDQEVHAAELVSEEPSPAGNGSDHFFPGSLTPSVVSRGR